MDGLGFVLLVILVLALYPIYLVWRFLTLGIKAFKKYLYGYRDYYQTSDYE